MDTAVSKTPIFLYHGIREWPEDAVLDPVYAVPISSFEAQISWLSRQGGVSLSMDEFLSAPKPAKNCFVLTVDDCFSSAFGAIFPVLSKYNFRALFFPVAGMVGRRGWVGWGNLREMLKGGMGIGSHALTHSNLAALPDREARREIAGSKKIIEDGVGAEVKYLSLPGGFYRRGIVEIAMEEGYEAVCCSFFGYNRYPPDRNRLKRICVRAGDGVAFVERVMNRRSCALAPRFALEKIKSMARKSLGERIYGALRRRIVSGAYAIRSPCL